MPIFTLDTKKRRTQWAKEILSIHSDDQFSVALQSLFKIQSQSTPAICSLAKSKKDFANDWKLTPALPQKIFKTTSLLSSSQATIEFHTSGTTTGSPGIHRMRDDLLYRSATQHGFPWKESAPFSILSLHPNSQSAPHSSLSAMINHWFQLYGDSSSTHCFDNGKVNSEKLWISLQKKRTPQDNPLLIIGTAFSFVHLFEDWGTDRRLKLPSDAVIMETGGYKGRSRELPKKELYHLIQNYFGVQDSQIWNEYGMCELSSQAYAQGVNGIHQPPPWARVIMIDPRTGKEVPIGKQGIVKWLDLANVDSSVGVQTLDFAIRHPKGFQLLGRAPQTEKRGCSLTIEREIVDSSESN